MTYVLAYDIGTTGVKTCLFALGQAVSLVESASQGYGLTILPDGGAEQDPGDWWSAMAATTPGPSLRRPTCRRRRWRPLLLQPDAGSGPGGSDRCAGAACHELYGPAGQGGAEGRDCPRRSDRRGQCGQAADQPPADRGRVQQRQGPLWKYKWVEAHEPEVFRRVWKWLDVKEYLILRCTGRAVMTPDSAYATFLYDTRRAMRAGAPSSAGCSASIRSICRRSARTEAVGGADGASGGGPGAGAGHPGFRRRRRRRADRRGSRRHPGWGTPISIAAPPAGSPRSPTGRWWTSRP